MTPSIDQTLHQFANLLPNWTLLPLLNLLPNFKGFHRTLQRVRLDNRGRLLLRTPGPVPFGTCICSNVETILSWTCHVYGPFEFRIFLGTSILLKKIRVSCSHATILLIYTYKYSSFLKYRKHVGTDLSPVTTFFIFQLILFALIEQCTCIHVKRLLHLYFTCALRPIPYNFAHVLFIVLFACLKKIQGNELQ